MKGLENLIRVRKWKLDEKRRELADFEALRLGFVKQLRALEDQNRREQEISAGDPEVGFSYAGYAAAVKEQSNNIRASIAEVDAKMAELTEEVAECYQELKKYQVALDAHKARERYEQKRVEQMSLDEIALELHRRKHGSR
ncbi:flagellar FliJ family protein [Sneathiella sp.]|uniref:flagellar FliJ family protein n=1 Tax=Sneathiella sp. TaxID=1964365 RepID=UPI002FDFCC92